MAFHRPRVPNEHCLPRPRQPRGRSPGRGDRGLLSALDADVGDGDWAFDPDAVGEVQAASGGDYTKLTSKCAQLSNETKSSSYKCKPSVIQNLSSNLSFLFPKWVFSLQL
ncbi:uncharacterized protein A4U43_C10F13260 [Asparagus officinalis]|uniref:Uncharacterized protein n=1 Tax=Asparagus officinalis TaxID=4686 RepID=A0A5P1E2E9_ASPOF|nr:uncharacterized protein A4U43_C10F13260 [Asparagus officinalis]